MERQTARKLFALLTFTAGAVAAYLMYRRGESLFTIAKNTVVNPIGSLASELQTTATSQRVRS